MGEVRGMEVPKPEGSEPSGAMIPLLSWNGLTSTQTPPFSLALADDTRIYTFHRKAENIVKMPPCTCQWVRLLVRVITDHQ